MSELPQTSLSRPAYRLYSAGQMTAATLLGTPLAGCYLLASNYERLGDRPARTRAWWTGILGLAGAAAVAQLLVHAVPRPVISVSFLLGFRHYFHLAQGRTFASHVAAGGRRWSHWRAASIGVVGFLVLAALLDLGELLMYLF